MHTGSAVLPSRFARWQSVRVPEWKLYSGRFLTGDESVARVVRLVELACEAERQSRPRRADFFWRESHDALRAQAAQGGDWPAVASDIFWDHHVAFARGSLEGKDVGHLSPDDRAFAHAGWMRQLVDLFAADAVRVQDLETLLSWKLDALQRAERSADARDAAVDLARLFPARPEYIARATDLQFAITSRLLEASGKNVREAENALRSGIARLTELRNSTRPHPNVLEGEAALRHALAVRLANSDRLSEALVESRRALTLDPSIKDGADVFNKMVELMRQLQSQAETVRAERRRGNRQLTAAGHALLADATRGFTLLETFSKSEEHARLQSLREQALALFVWRAAGLGEPTSDDARVPQLLEALAEILQAPPQTPAEVTSAWSRAIALRPNLQGLDTRGVDGYLRRRLFPDDPGTPKLEPTDAARLLSEGPSIVVDSRRTGWRDQAPTKAWLYSGRDLRVKAQAAFTLVLVVVTAALGAREQVGQRVRAVEYRDARAAAIDGKFEQVMDACNRFFAYSMLASDPREVEISGLFDEALVRWTVAESPSQDAVQRRVNQRQNVRAKARTP
jgi:hypothetical protein